METLPDASDKFRAEMYLVAVFEEEGFRERKRYKKDSEEDRNT